ncbi:MAG: beta-CASP ribonuclease aCPSF1 [Desulfurococcales archaeon]|nr:beta-CASP ribonuclease aCPSF1 [Desulfurococcales archaeon]
MVANTSKNKLSGEELRKQIILGVYNALRNAEITRIEFEGPEIAVYVKKPEYILDNENVVGDLARKLRKRIVLRTDPSYRKSFEATKKYLLEILPKEAGVGPGDIEFDERLGEVIILAENPNAIPYKSASFRNRILADTGWRPVVLRKPMLVSKTFRSILRKSILDSKERQRALRDAGERIFRDTLIGTRRVRVIGLGSFGEVGRSAILVDTGESRILLDAGAAPTGYGPDAFPFFDAPEFRIEDIDAVIISHAHLDHVGMLPLLFKYGYRGPVYMTAPTRDIAVLVLTDYMQLVQKEGKQPPFTQREINLMLSRTIVMPYNVVTDVAPDTKLTFANAGHILGSALVHLHIGQGLYNILYTGDIKYYRIKGDTSTRLLPPASYQFHRIETLIMESTYGATETQPRHMAEAQLIELINEAYKKGGKILIPVMAVGRGQDILVVLSRAKKEGKIPDIPVYVDGMVYEVTAIYTAYIDYLAKPIREAILQGENPFHPGNVVYVDSQARRDEAIYSSGPAIILATSGMMQGGPILEYFKHLAEDPKNILAFVSYQAPGTLGRRLLEGEREITFQENGRLRTIRVNLKIERVEGFTGHATQSELQLFLRHLTPKPRNIILNHGEPVALSTLGRIIKSKWHRLGFQSPPEILIPENLESITLYPRHSRVHTSLLYHNPGGSG